MDVRMPSDLLVRKANPIRASTAGQIEPQGLPELAPNLFQRAAPTKLSKRNLGSTELVMLLKEGAHFFWKRHTSQHFLLDFSGGCRIDAFGRTCRVPRKMRERIEPGAQLLEV
jgi:peptide subunit release factor RF-3